MLQQGALSTAGGDDTVPVARRYWTSEIWRLFSTVRVTIFNGASPKKASDEKHCQFIHTPTHISVQHNLSKPSGYSVYQQISLITQPLFRIWPRRTTTCSLDWKNNWKVAIFRPTRRSLLPRRPGWSDNFLNFFMSGLQKLEQRTKKCIELRGEYVEQIPSLVAVACFLAGRAKDFSTPSYIMSRTL
jgi:hypothetical protein